MRVCMPSNLEVQRMKRKRPRAGAVILWFGGGGENRQSCAISDHR